ncbi:hypothetical protein DNTS_035733, partial [Danionella cerebrum]
MADISHLLASVFNDLYTTEVIGKDTVCNLSKSRRGGNKYHEKYVKDLQEVHSEYNKIIETTDLLETHIIQARLQAAAKEEYANNKIVEDVGEAYHELGLPPANLTPGYAEPTVCYNMHITMDPQDDGYSPLPGPARTALSLLEQSEESLTLPSTPESSSRRPIQLVRAERSTTQTWTGLSACMGERKDRHQFLRNPRFLLPTAQRGGKSLLAPGKREKNVRQHRKNIDRKSPEGHAPIFTANPPVIFFTDYRIGQVYETSVELKNMTASSRHVRMIPPTSPYFSVGLGRFPGEGGIVAPGMSCQYMVRFAPDSLADYEDALVSLRSVPVPAVLDCGFCLVGGVKFMEVSCQNEGLSAGTFCVMPKKQWPASSLRSAVKSAFAEQLPFAISPCIFGLLPGQSTVIETIAVELYSVSGGENLPEFGELCDITADHYVRFNSTNPHATLEKLLVVKNNTQLELPYQWQIMKPNLQCLLPEEAPDPSSLQLHLDGDGAFSISPDVGFLNAAEEHEFLLTFTPTDLKDYHSVCHLVILDVPNPPRICNDVMCIDSVLHTNDVTVLEVEVKGSAESYKVLLEPYAVLIPGETYIHETIRKEFKMWNHSKSLIHFEWEREVDSHIIEVEPSAGEIEANECFDLELILTGKTPGHFTCTLQCHIQHHLKTVGLAVEVTFKGPHCSVNVPILDFGLLQMGDEGSLSFEIINSSLLDAHWSLEEVDHMQTHNEALVHLSVQAVVQSPRVCLLNSELLFDDLYVGVPVMGRVTLFNQTLLPAFFTWSKLQGAQAHLCSAAFAPHAGVLEPSGETEVTVSFTAHTVEELTEVTAVCEVEGMQNLLVLGVHSEDDGEKPISLNLSEHGPVFIGSFVTSQFLLNNRSAITAPFTVEAEYFTGFCPSQSFRQSK